MHFYQSIIIKLKLNIMGKISTKPKNVFVDGKYASDEILEYITFLESAVFKGQNIVINQYRKDEDLENIGISSAFIELLENPLWDVNTLKTAIILMYRQQNKTARVNLSSRSLSNILNKSESSVRGYKSNLEKLGIIDKIHGRGSAHMYQVNPYYIFKGNRINYFESIDRDLIDQVLVKNLTP